MKMAVVRKQNKEINIYFSSHEKKAFRENVLINLIYPSKVIKRSEIKEKLKKNMIAFM